MKLLVILALIAVASAIPGCAYFQTEEACFSGSGWTSSNISGMYGIPYCQKYDSPYKCNTCFPGYTGAICAKDTSFLNWTNWPTIADNTAQAESQNCLNYYVQLQSALKENYEGSTNAYIWNYENMSCIINGQQVCQTCKPGYRWSETKCILCPSNTADAITCLTCTTATTSTCTVCSPKFFLSSGTCTSCGADGILTCSAKDKALTCLSGYFKEGDKCTACENTKTLSCTSAILAEKCADGAYLDKGKCVDCAQPNVGTCNETAGNGGIKSCKVDNASNSPNTLYKNTTDGCISHPSTNKCKTIIKQSSTWYCASCFDGYFIDQGVCKTPEAICLHSADNLKYEDACNTLTNATTAPNALTFTCKALYYKEAQSTGQGKCRKCTSVGCGGNCVPNTSSLPPNCSSTVAATGYFLTAADTAAKKCTDIYDTGCKTCTNSGCTEVKDDTFFLCFRITTTVGSTLNTDKARKMACSKDYANTPPVATTIDSLDGSAFIASTNLITGCKSFDIDPTFTSEYNCTLCDRTQAVKKVVVSELASAGGARKAATAQLCKAGELGANGEEPVKLDKFKSCIQAKTHTMGSSGDTKCVKCDLETSIPAALQDGCTDIAAGAKITNCIKYKDATTCETCASTHKVTTTGDKCAAYVQFCATYQNIPATTTNALCETCNLDYVKKATHLGCVTCATTYNCKDYVIDAADAACVCKTCKAGYYVAADNLCSTANDDANNCFVISKTMTVKFECAVCKYGYVLSKTFQCEACSATTKNCVYTGCANQAYINKPTAPAAAATSYSSIISFLIMTLVALMTFMI